MTSRVETITPERAKELLGAQAPNRNIRQRHVDSLGAAMVAGDWQLTGEALVIDCRGRMVQGQHRCSASVKFGVSFTTLVVYGVDPETQDYMDIGAKRSAADALKLHGLASSNNVASALSYLDVWETSGHLNATSRTLAFTPPMALRGIERHPGIEEAVRLVQTCPTLKSLAPPSGVAAALYIAQQVDEEMVARFLEGVDRGIGLTQKDPRLVARERLLREKASPTPIRPIVRLWFVWRALAEYSAGGQKKFWQVPASMSKAESWAVLPGDSLRLSRAGA